MPATYEAIEQHLANVDFEQLSREYHERGAERALTGVPEQLCKVFQAVKPILSAVAVLSLAASPFHQERTYSFRFQSKLAASSPNFSL